MKHCLLLFALLYSVTVRAQSLQGIVTDEQAAPLVGATILLNSKNFTKTDANGGFRYHSLQPGTYLIKVSFIGHTDYVQQILLKKDQTLTVNIRLSESKNNLNEVQVKGLEQTETLRRGTFNVTALNAKVAYNQSATAGDIMNMTAGIILRENGGLGSTTSFLVNGLSGKQVKTFIDNIPIEYFGSAMNMSVLPVNSIERIAVYKGVVPIDLPGDGLGGAINAETNKQHKNRYELNYAFGSFNTHRGLFDIKKISESKNMAFGVSGFINSSDNNYPIDVAIPNEFGTPVPQTVKRFHDQYVNYRLESSLNILQRKWADVFTLSASYSGVKKEQQHGIQIGVPFGEVESREKHGLLYFRQKKQFSPKLSMGTFGGYAQTKNFYTDTTLKNYNWRGEVTKTTRSVGGETSTSRNLYQNNTRTVFLNANLKFNLNKNQLLSINSFHSYLQGQGKDSVASAFYDTDIFALPTSLNKNIIAVSLEQTLFDERLTSITSAKFLNYAYSGFFIARGATVIKTAQNNFGANQAVKFNIGQKGILKASYEYATRVPDATELFGFINIIRPNPGLAPERSHNANFGGQLNLTKFDFEANFFYRHTQNLIFLQANQFFAQFVNLLTARITGLEATVNYRILKKLSLKTDLTYQDIRNRSSPEELNIISNRYYNARVPNMPYLFGQTTLRYALTAQNQNEWQFWYSTGYVHEFYLNWAIDGRKETKAVIPEQLRQTIGVAWNLKKQHINIIAECKNLLNEENYSNYNVPLPGRSLNLKIRFFNL